MCKIECQSSLIAQLDGKHLSAILSILYKDASKASIAAESLKLTSKHLKKNKLIDKIIPEPLGGIHRDPDRASKFLKKAITKELKSLLDVPIENLIKDRHEKLRSFGRFSE